MEITLHSFINIKLHCNISSQTLHTAGKHISTMLQTMCVRQTIGPFFIGSRQRKDSFAMTYRYGTDTQFFVCLNIYIYWHKVYIFSQIGNWSILVHFEMSLDNNDSKNRKIITLTQSIYFKQANSIHLFYPMAHLSFGIYTYSITSSGTLI